LTAKPVQLPTTTGVLRMAVDSSSVSRMTWPVGCRWEEAVRMRKGG
jgi:hypothetical protein